MTVMVLQRVTPSLRGQLTRWMIEVTAGIFIGTLSKRVREKLWIVVTKRKGAGRCMLICSAPRTEQGFTLEVAGEGDREPVDFDGLVLMRRFHPGRRADRIGTH